MYLGALRATNNRGLQPAMDHIIENEGKPVPDPSAPAAAATPTSAGGDPMDVNGDDEDVEALRSLMRTQTGSSSSGAVEEAKMRSHCS